jgi:hypothetical protein
MYSVAYTISRQSFLLTDVPVMSQRDNICDLKRVNMSLRNIGEIKSSRIKWLGHIEKSNNNSLLKMEDTLVENILIDQ